MSPQAVRVPGQTRLDGPVSVWALAVLFFGFGDVVTTSVGLGLPGVSEAGPVTGLVVDRYGPSVVVLLKAAVLACCYLLWRLVPCPHRRGVPIGLVVVGVAATGWNLYVLALVTLP